MGGGVWPGTDGTYPSFITPGRESSGGGGGISPRNVSLEPVNLTDGSWTLFDPDNLIDTIVYEADGWHRVTFNALETGSVDYAWTSGVNHRGPRWYKPLLVDGVRWNLRDLGTLTTKFQCDVTVNDFNCTAVLGAADNGAGTVAASTATGAINGSGGMYTKATTTNPAYGVWARNSQTSGAHATQSAGFTTVFRGGLAHGSGAYINLMSDGNVRNQGSRNTNGNSGSNQPDQDLLLGLGTRIGSATIEAGDQMRFRCWYRAITFDKGVL